jgi:hypothetical protein
MAEARSPTQQETLRFGEAMLSMVKSLTDGEDMDDNDKVQDLKTVHDFLATLCFFTIHVAPQEFGDLEPLAMFLFRLAQVHHKR